MYVSAFVLHQSIEKISSRISTEHTHAWMLMVYSKEFEYTAKMDSKINIAKLNSIN